MSRIGFRAIDKRVTFFGIDEKGLVVATTKSPCIAEENDGENEEATGKGEGDDHHHVSEPLKPVQPVLELLLYQLFTRDARLLANIRASNYELGAGFHDSIRELEGERWGKLKNLSKRVNTE